MSSAPTLSMLAGLVKGYTSAKDEALKSEMDQRTTQRDLMLQYLGHLASNPNVPPEHQQWALQKASELTQHDITKKLPKIDLGELPPVMRTPPARQGVSQSPGMELTAPAAPVAPSAPVEVGKAQNGTSNMLGGVQMPAPPPGAAPPSATGAIGVVPGAPVVGPASVPPGAPSVIQNPQPPQQISPGGQIHVTTPAERATQATDIQESDINRLQQQYPMRSREELAYFLKHEEFPKGDEYTLGPGQARYKGEKEIARNEEAKPGAKSGYSVERGPSGEPLVKDNATGATLTPEQIQAQPEAKKLYDAEVAAQDKREKQQEAKEDRQFSRQVDLLNRREDASLNRQVTASAVNAAKQAKAMVDVLDTSERYMRSGNFSPRQDLALIVRAVRAMNPGTVRLPNKELELEIKAGSYGDRFKRWATGAASGVLPADQRADLMNVIREETTQTATSAAENWNQAFKGKQPAPTFLKRFAGPQVKQPAAPPTATAPTAPAGGFNWDAHPKVSQ